MMASNNATESKTETDSTSVTNFDVENTRVAQVGEEKASSIGDAATDEYPHGLRLVILIGAIMITVFLISLDQVSAFACTSEALHITTRGRRSSAPQSPKSQTSFTD